MANHWYPRPGKFRNRRERLKMWIYEILHIADSLVALCSFTLLRMDWAAMWLFSSYLEDKD